MELRSQKSRIIVGDSVSWNQKHAVTCVMWLRALEKEFYIEILKRCHWIYKWNDLESFIIFEDLLNNFWVIKSIEYCWKKVTKMSGFFLLWAF